MTNITETKILFVQRVITGYRLDLLKILCTSFKKVGVITSDGDKEGTLKVANFQKAKSDFRNLEIHKLPAIRFGYKGESRFTSFFLYPKAISVIKLYDIIVFEGTTNLINNFYLVPLARLFGKKIIWWDAGYSLPIRSFRRKIIDALVRPLIKLTHGQMAYSTLAKNYLTNHMGARNSFLNLNTINTGNFESISKEIEENNNSYQFDPLKIKLLYVGVIEQRKKVKELIDIVIKLNGNRNNKKFSLTIIGGGNQLVELNIYVKNNDYISLLGPIYGKEKLKNYYFESDLFVLPGDGGLAILQSLLFGLPVLSVIGADGTELDYIKDKSYLVKSIDEIEYTLENLKFIDRKEIINNLPEIKHDNWKIVLESFIKTL